MGFEEEKDVNIKLKQPLVVKNFYLDVAVVKFRKITTAKNVFLKDGRLSLGRMELSFKDSRTSRIFPLISRTSVTRNVVGNFFEHHKLFRKSYFEASLYNSKNTFMIKYSK